MGLASTFKALLRAVRRHRKLAAVAAATLLPVFLLSAVAVNFCARDISAAKTELTGTAYLRRSWSMVSACDARLPATEWSAVPLGPNVVPRPRLDHGESLAPCPAAKLFIPFRASVHSRSLAVHENCAAEATQIA